MKTTLILLIASLFLPWLARAESSCHSLVITGHPDYPPVAWAAGGEIVGAAPELVASIAAQLGVSKVVSKDFGSWEEAQRAAASGRADVIFGIYKNDVRERYLDYIEPPFMQDPVAIVVRRGERFAFAQWDDLKGRRGVTNAGESFGNRFDAYMADQLTVTRADGVAKAFEILLDKQADYLIIGLYPGNSEARRLGISAQLDVLPAALVTADMYVAFSKKSACSAALGSAFAARLEDAVQQGRVRQLLDAADRAFAK